MNKKRQIFYTREYRHMKNTPLPNVGKILFTLIPFYIILLICYDDFTYWLSDMAGKMLNAIYGVNYDIGMNDSLTSFMPVYYINLEGRKPSFTMCFVMLVVVVFLLIIVLQILEKYKSFMVYAGIFMSIFLVSDVFFIFFSDKFPYTLGNYADIYMLQQVIMWFAIAFVTVVALSLLPGIHGSSLLTFWSIMCFGIVYDSIRYIVFVVFLYGATSVFMAPLYLMCGVYLDFMYVVAIYSIYVKEISDKFDKREEIVVWEWS